MSNTMKNKTPKFTARQVATFLSEANTPAEKGTATRRLKAYVASRVAEGCDASRVEKNIQTLAKKLQG